MNHKQIYRDLDEALKSMAERITPLLADDLTRTLVKGRTAIVDQAILLEYLERDGMVICERMDWVAGKQYYISIKGKLFLAKGGYRNQARRDWWKTAWSVTRVIATTLYSLAVLYVAWIAYRADITHHN